MKVKIKRHEYEITKNDIFMDNGACIQLLTQSKENANWGRRPSPILSKNVIKEISKFKRIDKKHNYPDYVQIFSLDL